MLDYDVYSANDSIGKVYLDLNPFLSLTNQPIAVNSNIDSVWTGWLPLYDTMHGLRGELLVLLRVEPSDESLERLDASSGIQFFYCQSLFSAFYYSLVFYMNVYIHSLLFELSCDAQHFSFIASYVPSGFVLDSMPPTRSSPICGGLLGFVEELLVVDDPENEWVDRLGLRRARASNEARQRTFLRLAARVQRLIAQKALALAANAVAGCVRHHCPHELVVNLGYS